MLDNVAQLLAFKESLPYSLFYWNTLNESPYFSEWCDAGYLLRCEDSTAVLCPECDTGFVDVEWVEDALGHARGYRCCPQCGYDEISPDEVKRFDIDLLRLLTDCAQTMGLDPPKEAIPGTAWSLGRRKRKNFVYIIDSDSNKKRSIRQMFANKPETVFLVGTIDNIKSVETFTDHCVVSIEQFLDWEDGRMVFDQECFNDFFDSNETTSEKGKEKRRRAVRLAKIEELKKYLLADAAARIGNRAANYELGREYSIPKRPSKKRLANILKMSPVDVTNCFKDKEGKALILLYDNLETHEGLDRIKVYFKSIRYSI